jgi:glycosyltransferase involved in cell wall biosynthesis
MGLVMLEAANYNRATVARNVGGIAEFILDNVNGFLVGDKPLDMANKINIISPEMVRTTGINSNLILNKQFTDKVMAEKYFAVYYGLIC